MVFFKILICDDIQIEFDIFLLEEQLLFFFYIFNEWCYRNINIWILKGFTEFFFVTSFIQTHFETKTNFPYSLKCIKCFPLGVIAGASGQCGCTVTGPIQTPSKNNHCLVTGIIIVTIGKNVSKLPALFRIDHDFFKSKFLFLLWGS